MINRLVDLQAMLSSRTTHFWALVIVTAVATILALAWPATLQAQSESNVTLSSLSVSGVDGTAINLGTFDPTDTTYSATVASTEARVTVEATASAPDRVDVSFGPLDASSHDDGYQVNLQYGTNLILIGVFSWEQDHEVLNTYSVEITREGNAPAGSANIVSIHGQYQEGNVYASLAREGSTFPFVLTRTGDTSESLTVQVSVSSNRRTMWLPSDPEETVSVEFEAGHAYARLDVETTADSIATGTYQLYASLVRGAGYQVDPRGGIALWFVWEDDYRKLNLADISVIYRGAVVDIGKFDPTVTSYTGNVGSTVEYVTITATEPSDQIRAAILPGDSNPDSAGHQVDLSYGTNQIIVVAQPYGRGGQHINTYSLHINRAGSADEGSEAEVSAIGISLAAEGVSIPFLLTRTGDTSEALTAQVEVTEAGGDMVSTGSKGEFDVEFEAGHASARLDVSTNADEVWEEHSTVEVTVKEGSSYQVSSESGAASTAVRDDDVPTVTAALTVDSTEVEEGDEITATITFVTDGPKEPHAFMGNLLLRAEAGTAGEKDFQLYSLNNLSNRSNVSTSVGWGFDPVESGGVITSYQDQYSAKILITDDDRPEADESFRAYLEIGRLSKGALILDEDSDSHIITIRGGEETPASPDSFGYATVVVADSGTSGSAFTVTWTHARTCSRETASLTYAGNPAGQGYAAAIVPTGYFYLGSAKDGERQITRSRNDTEGMGTDFVVSLYCSGLVSEVPIPTEVKWHGEKPKPGTYSSEPPLSGLAVSLGTLSPAFSKFGSLYAILDLPNDQQQITLSPTVKSGYTVSWDPATDAELTVPGHQVDLDVGYNTIYLTVEPDQGGMSFTYDIIVKRSEAAAEANSPATGTPTISGTAQVGQTLTADTTSIADTDGLTNVSYQYQWLAAAAEIDSAGNTYVLTSAELGKAVKVRVSFIDDAGNRETLTSAATAAVAAKPNSPATGAPTISGTAQVGETLTADTTGIADSDGLADVSYNYQWLADEAEIASAIGKTYVLTSAELGKAIKARVSFADDAGNEETLTSEATAAVAAAPPPPPDNVRAVTQKSGAVELTWEAPDDATVTGYRIERRRADEDRRDNHTLVEDTGSSETGYTDESAEKGMEYEYRVSARNEDGAGEASGWVSAAPDEEPVAGEDVAVWSAIMTVEWVYQGYGYYSTDAKKAGSLSPASFEVDGTTYTVKMVETQGWWMYIGLDRELPFDFVLELDGVRFASNDASFASYSYGNIYRWEGTGLSLRDGDTVEVRLLSAFEDETTVNSAATGVPVISGTAQVGETLTADTSGIADEDGLDDVSFSYQWLAGDTEIQGATNADYTLADADEGKTVTVQVSFTDDAGNDETLTSAATDAVSAAPTPNSPATGQPIISGTVQVGEALTADTSGIEDADGLTNATLSYQWLADDADISGATGFTYTLTDSDEGKAIKVQVSFTDDAGNDETLTSAATDPVEAALAANSPATGVPTISGTAQVGETLTANTSGVADADGLSNVQYEYQWLANDSDISGATNATYTLAAADEGKAIQVQVSFTDDAGNDETLTSAATDAVAAETQPNNPATGAPTISGTAQVGETLTVDTSDIADVDGLNNADFSYQWQADDTAIQGAMGSSYTLADTDEGKAIKVRVSFTDDGGNDETLTSAATDAVAAPEPPARPTGLTAEVSHDSVTLTWDDPNDDTITGYVILRRNRDTDAEGQFTELAPDTGTAATTYTDDTVAAETPYTYRIKAINAHGSSERSRWFHIDTLAGPEPTQEPTPEPESVSEGDTDLPNDNSTPGRVAVGGSATGAIGTAGDQDRFAVELVAGRTYQFDLTGSPGGGGTLPDTFFRAIYNSEGQYQADSYNDDFDGGRDSRVTFTPTESGTYYARVSGDRDEVGSYTLSVTDVTP